MIAFEDYIGGGLFKICRESWWDIITLDMNCSESAEESCPPPNSSESVSRPPLHNPPSEISSRLL